MTNTIIFNKNSGEYNYLSNSHESSFNLDDWRWRSVEHYYQAIKFQGFPRIYHEIRESPANIEVKRYAEFCERYCREDWEQVRLDTMRTAVLEKFRASKDLTDKLLATGDAYFIHDTEHAYWGRGKDGKGRNWLGKILMETREVLSVLHNKTKST